MALKVKYHGTYPKQQKDGSFITMFRYTVEGNKEEVAKYEQAVGEQYLRKDVVTGKPYWFTKRAVMDNTVLVVTDEDKIYADISELQKQASIVESMGGNLGVEMAKLIAVQISNSNTVTKTQAVKQTTEADLGEL